MQDSKIIDRLKYILSFSAMLIIWGMLFMVWADKFPRMFYFFRELFMPWKKLGEVPIETTLEERMAIMQRILDSSNDVANYAFLAVIVFFSIFSIYITFIYQQKQRRVQENRLLVLKNQEIARRNEFIRYISATIGHEFKNNLGRIKRRLELLPELQRDVKERIDNNLEKLFADIEIFKKISDEREAGLMSFSNVDIAEIFHSLAVQYSDMVDLEIQKDMSIPMIFASKTLLKTVFDNIIDNSIKYKKPEQPRARIYISSTTDIDGTRWYVSLSFRDKGIGMDEEQADKCFYIGKGTAEGWGQGLYFAKYVVGLHAGKIRVSKEYTAPGIGTEIIINLPFVREASDV